MLKQLPIIGTWVDPATITYIDARERRGSGQVYIPDHVLYVCGENEAGRALTGQINCPSYEEACTIRDQIAAMVNEAKAAGKEPA